MFLGNTKPGLLIEIAIQMMHITVKRWVLNDKTAK